MNAQFWQGKRVFITGHTGFKGSWLSLWLQQLGAHVTGYALPPNTNPSLFELAEVASGMESIIGDVRDGVSLKNAMLHARPEIVIHMAAQPLVRYSYANPVETYETNVMGLVHLLEAVRATSSIRAVVNVTSDKCYENREWVWGYRENDPMGGHDPYSNSKGCAELVTAAYRNSFFGDATYASHGVALASARAGNVIGGGDWAADRLIPDILRALESGQVADIRNPAAVRPWQHVLEPLAGYMMLAEKLYTEGLQYTGGWNFGPSDADVKSVEWIAGYLAGQWGDGAGWTTHSVPQLHEAHTLRLDCSKARMELQWKPRWSLEVALGHILQWHKAYLSGESMKDVCVSQIGNYSSQH